MIEIAVGLPGQGKTIYAVWRGLRVMKAKRPVYANFALQGAQFITLQQLINKEIEPGAFVVWDEAHLDFNSRNWREFGDDLSRFFSQTRKIEITLLLISQDISTIDKIIRDRCGLVHRVAKIQGFSKDHPFAFSVKSYYGAKGLDKEKFLAGNAFFRFKKILGDSYDTFEILKGSKS